jgi:N-methylhydantoinase A
MARALRVITVQRGLDPRRYALLAFGGAGPLHAALVAAEIGIDRGLCPRASGVLAALGLVVSERRRDVQRSLLLSGSALTQSAIAQAGAELAGAARRALGESGARLRATYELRYRGQSFELSVSGRLGATPEELRQAFERRHEEHYGYRDSGQPLELVTLRVSAASAGAQLDLANEDSPPAPERHRRPAVLEGREAELEVLRGSLAPGTELAGPCIVELPESTVLVPGGWSGRADERGTVCIERDR